MTTLTEGSALGDIVLYEAPSHYAREEFEVTRVLAATEGLQVGRAMDFDAAVAGVQTYQTETAAPETWVADGGTYRLGYKGEWTTPLAWNASVATINTALDVMVALSGGSAGDIVFANVGGDLLIKTNTFTFLNSLGNVPDVVLDMRLTTDATYAGRSMHGHSTITTTTAGELATMKMVASTTANADCVLLEAVSLTELQNDTGEALRRPFLVRGPSIVNVTAIYEQVAAGTIADLITALEALGIQTRIEPIETVTGTPSV